MRPVEVPGIHCNRVSKPRLVWKIDLCELNGRKWLLSLNRAQLPMGSGILATRKAWYYHKYPVPQLYNPLFFAAEGKLCCKIEVVALIAHEYINEHTGNTRVNRFIHKCLIKTAVISRTI